MGNYLTKGTTFADGGPCNAALLNAHVDDAIIKATAISSQILKDPAALSDEILINDGGTLKKVTAQQLHNLILYPGCVVQTQYGEFTALTIITSIIPLDDTIPQNTEGTEILSVSITPRFSTSQILCRFQGWADANPNTTNIVALFRGSNVNALASTAGASANVGYAAMYGIEYLDSPATTSATTYTIRAGPGTAGNFYFNGLTTLGRQLGGSSRATLVVQEIKQ